MRVTPEDARTIRKVRAVLTLAAMRLRLPCDEEWICFDLAQRVADLLTRRGFYAWVPPTEGHSFVLFGRNRAERDRYIADLWDWPPPRGVGVKIQVDRSDSPRWDTGDNRGQYQWLEPQ